MRVISINTNGIRAAARKGFFDWLPRQRADFICVQETKAQIDQLSDPQFHPKNFHCSYFDALKKATPVPQSTAGTNRNRLFVVTVNPSSTTRVATSSIVIPGYR